MLMTNVIKCNSLRYVICNAKKTLFDMSLLWLGLGQIMSSIVGANKRTFIFKSVQTSGLNRDSSLQGTGPPALELKCQGLK